MLFLLRHGTTPGNLRRAFVGSVDQPLSPQGREELAALTAQGIYPPVDTVLSSPMRRCIETAGMLYPGREIVPVEGLQERCFGDFEGLSHDEIIALPGYADWGMNRQSMDFPGGEEREAFFARCVAAFRQAANGLDGDAALILHGGVIMALMERLCTTRRDYFDWHCPNGLGYRVDWADGQMILRGRLGE